jgi:hypothetical protein
LTLYTWGIFTLKRVLGGEAGSPCKRFVVRIFKKSPLSG